MHRSSLPHTLLTLTLTMVTAVAACDVEPVGTTSVRPRKADGFTFAASKTTAELVDVQTYVVEHDADVTALVGLDAKDNEVLWIGSTIEADGTSRLDWKLDAEVHSLAVGVATTDEDGNLEMSASLDGQPFVIEISAKGETRIDGKVDLPLHDLAILGSVAGDVDGAADVVPYSYGDVFWCLLEAGLAITAILDCLAPNPSSGAACYVAAGAASAAAHACLEAVPPQQPPKEPGGGGGATGEECSGIDYCEEGDEKPAVCGNDVIEPGESCEGEPYDGTYPAHICPFHCVPERYCGDTCNWETVCECQE